MAEPRIEKAMSYDVPVLNQISIQSKMHWNYPNEWLQNWLETLRVDREYLEQNFVYKLTTDRIIGFCALVKHESNYEVTHLWVLPEYIGQGLGKLLLTETLTRVVANQSEIIVEADPNAEKFYQKMGFATFSQKESFPKGRFLPLMKRIFP